MITHSNEERRIDAMNYWMCKSQELVSSKSGSWFTGVRQWQASSIPNKPMLVISVASRNGPTAQLLQCCRKAKAASYEVKKPI